MDTIYESYTICAEAKVSDKELIKFFMDEFSYDKKEATKMVKSLSKKERKEHEKEILGRKSGMDRY